MFYDLIDLGPSYDKYSIANDINNSNVVVGASTFEFWKWGYERHYKIYYDSISSSRWHNSSVNSIYSIPDGPSGYAKAVNDASPEQILTNEGNTATLWRGGVVEQDLFGLLGAASSVRANDINSSGVVVGSVDGQAFLYESGTGIIERLPSPTFSAEAINNLGVVVGTNESGSGAFIRQPDGVISLLPLFLNNVVVPTDINEKGEVVGSSQGGQGGSNRAFLFDQNKIDGSQMIELPGFPGFASKAFGINFHGVIVGITSVDRGRFSPSVNSAAIWYRDHDNNPIDGQNLNDLIPDSGWILQTAFAINDVGCIVGEASNQNGQIHGFLLIPRKIRLQIEDIDPLAVGVHDTSWYLKIRHDIGDPPHSLPELYMWLQRGIQSLDRKEIQDVRNSAREFSMLGALLEKALKSL